MPRGIRKRSGSYYIRLTDASGKAVEVKSSKTTKTEADAERAQLVMRERAKKIGTWHGSETITVNEAWEERAKVVRLRANWPQTVSRYRKHVFPALGDKKLLQVTPADVEALLEIKESEGYSAWQRRHIRAALVALFNWAKKARLFTGDNPAELAEVPEIIKKRPRFLPFDRVQLVVDAVPAQWRNFFALAVYTGLRCGELRALTHADVERNFRGLDVSKSGTRNKTKTGAERFVPLPFAALPYLKDAIKQSKGRPWLFVDDVGEQLSKHVKYPEILRMALDKLGLISTYVALCQRGCKVRVRGISERESWWCPECGKIGKVKPESPLVFHDLRKTWETHMKKQTGDLLGTARMAGHGVEVAAGIYIGDDDEQLHIDAAGLDFKRPALPLPKTEAKPDQTDAMSDAGDREEPSETTHRTKPRVT